MSEHERKFVSYIETICANNRTRADLRRSLGKEPHEALTAHRYVADWLGDHPSKQKESALYLVAALRATWWQKQAPESSGNQQESETENPDEPEVNESHSFGQWLGANKNSSSQIERRLYQIARVDSQQLRHHLPRLMSTCKTTNPVPWSQLLKDLTWWDKDPNIAKRWIQDFHRQQPEPVNA